MTSTLMGNTAQSPAPSTMMAWRVHEFGPPEAMIFETAPRPDPVPEGEGLAGVHAAGVGPWDGWIRAGKSAMPQPLPLTLGSTGCPAKSRLFGIPGFPGFGGRRPGFPA